MDRYDVVLLGPTGVTGREVARYLAWRAPEVGLTWAVAGRSRGRIEQVLDGLASQPAAVLDADTDDASSIDAVAECARVVANLVGPYARHGEVVYAACAERGVHEVDLTGEIDWLRRMIDTYGKRATTSGARLVPTCGFEALPFDLGALLAARTASERSGEPVVAVDVSVTIASSGRLGGAADAVSGGTFTSGVELLRRGPGPVLSDPFALDPPGSMADGRYEMRPRRHPGTGEWMGPMFPSPFLNPPVAHRSAALLRAGGDPTFARGYRYREGVATTGRVPATGASIMAPLAAGMLGSMQFGFGLLARAPGPVRRAVADVALRLGPKAGEGPRPETLDAWTYRLDVRATTASGRTADVVVDGVGHPGYKSTATMVGEAALLLADEHAPPATAQAVPSGFLTPAVAFGLPSLDRFAHAGLTFRVVG